MAGYKKLDTNSMKKLLDAYWAGRGHSLETINLDRDGQLLSYFSLPDDVIFITSPIQVNDLSAQINRLEKYVDELDKKHILVGVIGRGFAKEQHILTAYRRPEGKWEQFDSKQNNANHFEGLEHRDGRRLFQRKASQEPLLVTYHSLKTQDIFDAKTCGMHTHKIMLAVADLIAKKKDVSAEAVIAQLNSPAAEVGSFLRLDSSLEQKADNRFKSFVKKAWFNTFMPLERNKTKREKASFVHYFLGWPEKDALSQKLGYFFTLRFITKPLSSVIKLPTEFLLNFLSETARYLKNQLMGWSPKQGGLKYVRTGLMATLIVFQWLFKGLALAIRPITSPIDSYKAAKKKGGVYAGLSLFMSVLFYAALVVLLAPVLLTALFAKGGALLASAAVQLLAKPVLFLLSQSSVSIAAETAALASVLISSSLLVSLFLGAKSIALKLKQVFARKTDKERESENFLTISDDASRIGSSAKSLSILGGRRESKTLSSSGSDLGSKRTLRDSLLWERSPRGSAIVSDSSHASSFSLSSSV